MAADRGAIHRLLEAQILGVWGKGDLDLVDRNYAEAVADAMPLPGQATGRAPLKAVVRQFRAAIPDLCMTLHATLACGRFGVDVWTLTGTHAGSLFGEAPTGRPIRFSGIDMIEVDSRGRIERLWPVEELARLAGAVGLAPHRLASIEPVPPPADGLAPGARAWVPDARELGAGEAARLAVARRHIEGMWATGDASLAAELYHPDVVDHMPAPGQRPGIAGILDALHLLRDAAPDLRMAIEAYVPDGDLVADRWRLWGTHMGAPLFGRAPAGRRFDIAGMDVVRIDNDGRITDIWHVEEFHRLLAQLDPAPA